MKPTRDNWNSSTSYEYFMGRWSTRMAPVFLNWLDLPAGLDWLDLGCGTGALSEAISKNCRPASQTGVDPSPEFLEKAKTKLAGKGSFAVGSASAIPTQDHTVDVVVSGLALNFFPDLDAALAEMQRVLKPGGTLAAYVWDYADRMDFLRIFWDTALEIDPASKALDEGVRFKICNRIELEKAFSGSGLAGVETALLDIETVFANFDNYWTPFLGGQGPAPGYLASLNPPKREAFKLAIQKKLPVEADGSIRLLARAIGVKGVCG
ncbi:MAG: class I SAM-dependent methyltransferase [Saprospiraceae bacterium]|nr:class I SAM-dependent methyltransferase [Saprospiraceae bacterium]